jgi:LPXTG-motif cell wall-anchored protein
MSIGFGLAGVALVAGAVTLLMRRRTNLRRDTGGS